MSEFRFRVPGFARPTAPIPSDDFGAGAASPTSTALSAYPTPMKSKFRITQFVRETKHVDSAKAAAAAAVGVDTPKRSSGSATKSPAPTPAPPSTAAPPSTDKLAAASYKSSDPRTAFREALLVPKPLADIQESAAISKAKQARRSLPNLKLVPPTHFNSPLPFNQSRTPPPVDPSRSVEWNKVVRSIQATSLEAIVTKLLDALSDRPESGPGTLVAHLGDIFLDDATKQMYKEARSTEIRLLPIRHARSTGPPTSTEQTPVAAANLSTPGSYTTPQTGAARLPTPAATQRRSLSGAIPRPTPGGMLIAPKLFEPREYKPNHTRKLKRKSEADKDGLVSKLLSVKRNASLGELSNVSNPSDGLGGGEPPVKRKRGRPKGSTKAAIQERESLKMQASAAEQVSETLTEAAEQASETPTETATVATESVSPVLEENRSLPTSTSIELRASSPSPIPYATNGHPTLLDTSLTSIRTQSLI
ncbi:hypothetical protein DRE_01182 [Drechslerella stenobrocha 248]|uniref:Uncharacterized protein n=1 Tax=Drechslerella stenobrocha 248 TaxID=1043628 RepID=W7HK35_9PEZI|nr:hypothetical protein DRE_01182 [Drechslerella stenobrocha 248]